MIEHNKIRIIDSESGYEWFEDIDKWVLRIPCVDENIRLGQWMVRVTGVMHIPDRRAHTKVALSVVMVVHYKTKPMELRSQMLLNGWEDTTGKKLC